MIKTSILLLSLISSISMLEAVDGGVDKNITLGDYATLNATGVTAEATVKWSILNDVYSNERIFYFSPSSIGIYNIHLTSSDGSDDYVKIQVLSEDGEDSNQNSNENNATIIGDDDIIVGETATFSTTYQGDTQLSWKLNGDTYAYGNIFYFTPEQTTTYNLTLSDEDGELTQKTINIKEENTPPPPPESNCTAKTTNNICLMLSKNYSQLAPNYPSCYKNKLLLKHGDNPITTIGISLDLKFRPYEPCDRQPITDEKITPLKDGGYLVEWLAGYLSFDTMFLKKFNTNGEEDYFKEGFIPKNYVSNYQIEALKNGNFIATWSTYTAVIVKVYSPNVELLSEHSLASPTGQKAIIDTESYSDGSFDIKYKVDLHPTIWKTKHFSGN